MLITELLRRWTYGVFAPGALLRKRYGAFRKLLEHDVRALELLADMEEMHAGVEVVDYSRVLEVEKDLEGEVSQMVDCLDEMSPTAAMGLREFFSKAAFYVRMGLDTGLPALEPPYALRLSQADDPEIAGGKAACLSRVVNETDLNVPDGVVVTASAFHYFIEANNLRDSLDAILRELRLGDPKGIEEGCRAMRQLILDSPVPDEIVHPMLESTVDIGSGPYAVRSSAVAEDGRFSFAGQYDSFMDVKREDLPEAYREVLAGKYSPKAVTYRMLKGLSDTETHMAVLIQPMITSSVAGVMYTKDADATQCVGGVTAVYAVEGHAGGVVSGRREPNVYCLTREDEPVILQKPAHHEKPGAGLLLQLAKTGYRLERLFGGPQDVEWVADSHGALHILQSRPMQSEEAAAVRPEEPQDMEVLISGGVRISAGVGAGRVVHSIGMPDTVPEGAVLVTRSLIPELVGIMDRLSAVISVTGSRAGHFASVAREFGLPVLVSPYASELIEGRLVTVDAERGSVYAGRIPGLEKRRHIERNVVAERLDSVMQHLSTLNLTDPEDEGFAPEGCRSIHDVIRFTHETAVREMFSLVGRGGKGMGRVKQLKTRIPMALYLLDLGGGLFSHAREETTVSPEDVTSTPMWALWWGFSRSGIDWDKQMPMVDWQELDRISAGIITNSSRALASYAVVAADYAHFMFRFGYHFAVVDSVCGPDAPQNHINLRFKGGGGHWEQRIRRLDFIRTVLESRDFEVSIKGDMLDARCSRLEENDTRKRLVLVGRLLAHSRLMDVRLDENSDPAELAATFIEETERPGTED
ncbi:PEP/pyruvate-binding domain-containing protein [Salidesulfovibrio brasiliensis]|uniref:PEP/pyruvate-binding domain-containing protein n=1 Tax=Salidesulfovibrio brasiliensis TaxID=221711 RepID=UPI0006D0870B|nr:PEP/pyruvate-binding domain-containing protein [Salidesulfovibrio brasiliensis]